MNRLTTIFNAILSRFQERIRHSKEVVSNNDEQVDFNTPPPPSDKNQEQRKRDFQHNAAEVGAVSSNLVVIFFRTFYDLVKYFLQMIKNR